MVSPCRYEPERLEHRNSGWCLYALTVASGQSVVSLEAKDLLLCRRMSWQAHSIDALGVCVEGNVMQVRSSMQPVVVCRVVERSVFI